MQQLIEENTQFNNPLGRYHNDYIILPINRKLSYTLSIHTTIKIQSFEYSFSRYN